MYLSIFSSVLYTEYCRYIQFFVAQFNYTWKKKVISKLCLGFTLKKYWFINFNDLNFQVTKNETILPYLPYVEYITKRNRQAIMSQIRTRPYFYFCLKCKKENTDPLFQYCCQCFFVSSK